MGFWSSITSGITDNAAEKQTDSTKDKLFSDFDATVERLKNFDLEAPPTDKAENKLPSQSNRIKKT